MGLTACFKMASSFFDTLAQAATRSCPCADSDTNSFARATMALSTPFIAAQLRRCRLDQSSLFIKDIKTDDIQCSETLIAAAGFETVHIRFEALKISRKERGRTCTDR